VLHLLITARANHGPADGRGVIGHAWSADGGASFQVGPPLSEPGELRQLEVPQLVELAPDCWTVLASCRATDHARARLARPGTLAETGTVALEGTAPFGPFVVPPGGFLLGDPHDRAYAGRLVELNGRRWLVTWTDTVDGAFVGELADPIPLETGPDGRLALTAGMSR
jgi:beta-fructofuranosidase